MKKGMKRFTLNRETLRNLDEPSLTAVAGGAATANPTACAPNSMCVTCASVPCVPTLPPKTCPTFLCN